jgi:energy-coupling factor transporter transmembrane protein EcfT
VEAFEQVRNIMKRHHIAAILTMLLAFLFIILVGFFLDDKLFQMPAAASVSIMFALAVAVLGSLSYFLRSWSFLFIIIFFIVVNTLYHYNIIDPRNKAYGLNYSRKDRPEYSLRHLSSLNTPQKIASDKKNMLQILDKWKANQKEEKPLMIFFNFSGGGLRGAAFSMNVLQQLDSAANGSLMNKTVLMSGASGGMLGASYYRELSRLAVNNSGINPNDKLYVEKISEDLLNPVFSSMIARDIISPVQKFSVGPYRYSKDRGYSFERKLNQNTEGILDHPIGFYKPLEKNATIPLMILNPVITRDFKKLMICTQPLSFMMQEEYLDSSSRLSGPDAIDFSALFSNTGPMNLGMLTALRMNATYPYILPAVWLPSNPVIDVMDAGLRDNNGQETTLRFLRVFKDWINENTRGVLIIQIRSRQKSSWDNSFKSGGIGELVTKPFTMMQKNLFMVQDYYQNDEITYAQSFLDSPLHRVAFMYIPEKEQSGASLNFHLTANEKVEVQASLKRKNNVEAFEQVRNIMKR